MNKRGQFYLIAAIIIIVVIIGFVVTINYSKRSDIIKLYDLGDELKIESENVIAYGVYNSLEMNGLDGLLKNFTQIYTNYSGEGKDLYFVFGDDENITLAGYTDLGEGTVSLKIPGQEGEEGTLLTGDNYIAKQYPITSEDIVVVIGDLDYHFALSEGDYFYFVIAQEIEGEHYIFSSE